TAVTLVPALAETAEHVTMLQRSPTYILAMPTEDGIAVRLRRMLGARRGYAVTRWKNVAITTLIYKLSRRRPDMIRGWIRQMADKGMMLSGVPNFAFTIGYTNASWTLKADLVSEFACRLLKYMDARGYDTCVPVNDDPAVTPQPLLDFQAGYVLRSIDQFPRA